MTTTAISSNNGVVTRYYGTGTGAISETISPGDGYQLVSVCIHNAVAPTTPANITVTFRPEEGSVYYTSLLSQGMSGVTDLVWQPNKEFLFSASDSVVVAWANSDGVTYGLDVTFKNV